MAGDPITSANTVLMIGPVADKTINTAAKFAALQYTEVGLAESIGEFGDESAAITFTGLSSGRVLKLKGPRDGGTVPLTVGHDPLDPGQILLAAAELVKFAFAFKIVYPDRPNPSGTDSVEYFRALVMSRRKNVGDASAVLRRSYPLAINSDIVEVAATMGS